MSNSRKKTLFQEVALDPFCLQAPLILEGVNFKFGMTSGRYISAFPNDWKNKALQIINSLEDELYKKRAKAVLSKPDVLNCIITSDRKYRLDSEWIAEVIEASSAKPFGAIISNKIVPLENSYIHDEFDDYIMNSDGEVGSINFTDIKSTDDFLKNISPFLKTNKKIALINKWQWLLTDNKRVADWFVTLMDFWIKCGGVEATVIRSANERKGFDHERFKKEGKLLDQYLSRKNFSGTFKYIAIDDSQNELHARALIGNVCGIHLDFGLEMTTKRHPWSLMNKASFQTEYHLYLENDIRNQYPNNLSYVFKPKKIRV